MLASPRPEQLPDAQRQPAHQPEPQREDGQQKVQRMAHARPHKKLLMSASRAVCACFVLSHLSEGDH